MRLFASHSRNRDFVFKCQQRLAELKSQGESSPDIGKIITYVLSKPAQAYYVDYYQACHIMTKALITGKIPTGVYTCTEQWSDMYADLLTLLGRHPTRPLRSLVFDLCAGLAGKPRFYISPARAAKILHPYISTELTIKI